MLTGIAPNEPIQSGRDLNHMTLTFLPLNDFSLLRQLSTEGEEGMCYNNTRGMI